MGGCCCGGAGGPGSVAKPGEPTPLLEVRIAVADPDAFAKQLQAAGKGQQWFFTTSPAFQPAFRREGDL